MKNKKLAALVLCAALVVSTLAGCTGKDTSSTPASVDSTASTSASTDTTSVDDGGQTEAKESTMVYATSAFGQKFSPFFATTAYDMEVVDLTQAGLLAADRGGAVIKNGIAGTDVDYNGTSYNYKGMGDVEVVQNADGSVDYKLTMRDDVKFSDGEPATIDDVIFYIYPAVVKLAVSVIGHTVAHIKNFYGAYICKSRDYSVSVYITETALNVVLGIEFRVYFVAIQRHISKLDYFRRQF